MIKGAHLGPIWYHSEPSDIPYPQTSFLVVTFFNASYSKIALVTCGHDIDFIYGAS